MVTVGGQCPQRQSPGIRGNSRYHRQLGQMEVAVVKSTD